MKTLLVAIALSILTVAPSAAEWRVSGANSILLYTVTDAYADEIVLALKWRLRADPLVDAVSVATLNSAVVRLNPGTDSELQFVMPTSNKAAFVDRVALLDNWQPTAGTKDDFVSERVSERLRLLVDAYRADLDAQAKPGRVTPAPKPSNPGGGGGGGAQAGKANKATRTSDSGGSH